jgi:hypothetical protein
MQLMQPAVRDESSIRRLTQPVRGKPPAVAILYVFAKT